MTSNSITENATILVVEDDSQIRRIMARTLRAHGWSVLEAENGEDALDVAGNHAAPVHAIVSDVKMPNMGGLELVFHFRRWYPGVRALLVSGDPHVVGTGGSAGEHVTLLAKPFTPETLVQAVQALLE